MLICADRAKPASVKRRCERERERNQSVVVTHSQFGHTQKTVVLTHVQTADPLLTGIVPLSLMSDPPFLGQCWSQYHITVINGPRKLFQMLY